MIEYLKFIKYISLLLVGCSFLGAFFLFSSLQTMTLGGELILLILIIVLIYFLITFAFATVLFKAENPHVFLVIILSVLFFTPFLGLLNIEGSLNAILPSFDMK